MTYYEPCLDLGWDFCSFEQEWYWSWARAVYSGPLPTTPEDLCLICQWQFHTESEEEGLLRLASMFDDPFGCCKHYNTILCECPVEPDPAATAKLKAFLP